MQFSKHHLEAGTVLHHTLLCCDLGHPGLHSYERSIYDVSRLLSLWHFCNSWNRLRQRETVLFHRLFVGSQAS